MLGKKTLGLLTILFAKLALDFSNIYVIEDFESPLIYKTIFVSLNIFGRLVSGLAMLLHLCSIGILNPFRMIGQVCRVHGCWRRVLDLPEHGRRPWQQPIEHPAVRRGVASNPQKPASIGKLNFWVIFIICDRFLTTCSTESQSESTEAGKQWRQLLSWFSTTVAPTCLETCVSVWPSREHLASRRIDLHLLQRYLRLVSKHSVQVLENDHCLGQVSDSAACQAEVSLEWFQSRLVSNCSYRFAPEFPYPIPTNDCWNATMYVLEHEKDLKVNTDQLILAGDSSGESNLKSPPIRIVSQPHCTAQQPYRTATAPYRTVP